MAVKKLKDKNLITPGAELTEDLGELGGQKPADIGSKGVGTPRDLYGSDKFVEKAGEVEDMPDFLPGPGEGDTSGDVKLGKPDVSFGDMVGGGDDRPTQIGKIEQPVGGGTETGDTTETGGTGTGDATSTTTGGSTGWEPRQTELYGGLDESQKQIFDQMSDTEKNQFWEIGATDVIQQTKYLQAWKENDEYIKSQKRKKTYIDELTGEIIEINASERINNSRRKLQNLQQSMAYIGTMGAPGVSAVKMKAMETQLSDAEQTFQNLKTVEANLKRMRITEADIDTEQYERQMELLQDELDSKVSDAIQQAMGGFSAADLEGKLDTIEGIQDIGKQLFTDLDSKISGLTEANLQQRQFVIDKYNQLANDAKTFIANKNKWDLKPGGPGGKGYYVDGNGTPLIGADGGFVFEDKKPLYQGTITAPDGSVKFISVAEGEDGKPVMTETTLLDQPKFTADTIKTFADMVNDGIIDYKTLISMNPGLANNTDLMSLIEKKTVSEDMAIDKTVDLGGSVRIYKKDGTYEDVAKTTDKTKTVDDRIDLGDKWKVFYTDGTSEEIAKSESESSKKYQSSVKLGENTRINYTDGSYEDFDKNGKLITEYKGAAYNPIIEEDQNMALGEFFMNNPIGNKGGQCGAFVNDYLQDMGVGRIFKDPITQKKQNINSYTKKPGSIAIMNSKTKPQYGHVAIIRAINEDGTLLTIESNKAGEEKIFERSIDPADVIGYFDPTIDINKTIEAATEVVTGDEQGIIDKVDSIMDPMSNIKLSDFTGTTKETLTKELNKRKKEALESGDIYGVMLSSAGGKEPTDTFRTSFEKGLTVISQLSALEDKIVDKDKIVDDEGIGRDISPISGWLREKNPWDTNAQSIKAIIQGTVPNLARGVFGEVGVLTDRDIALYAQTIPNLRQTNDVKKAVLALTLRTVKNALDNKIQVQARTGVDMSGLTDFYREIDDKITEMERGLGMYEDGASAEGLQQQGSGLFGMMREGIQEATSFEDQDIMDMVTGGGTTGGTTTANRDEF